MKIIIRYIFLLMPFFVSAQTIFNEEWMKIISTESGDFIYPHAICTDLNGNIYIGLESQEPLEVYNEYLPGSNNAYLIKLSSTGDLVWYKHLTSYFGYNYVYVRNIIIDNDFNIILPGYFSGSLYINQESYYYNGLNTPTPFIIKFNSEGNVMNLKILPDSVFVKNIQTDSENNIIGVGENAAKHCVIDGFSVDSNFFVFKLNSNFEAQWIINQNVRDNDSYIINTYDVRIENCVVDVNDNIYVNYIFDDSLFINSELYLPDNYYDYHLDSIWIDYDSVIYYTDTNYVKNFDGLIVKYTPDGEFIWGSLMHGSSDSYFYHLTTDLSNHVYAIGGAGTYVDLYLNDEIIIPGTEEYSSNRFILNINEDGTYNDIRLAEDSIPFYNGIYYADSQIFVPGNYEEDDDLYTGAAIASYSEQLDVLEKAHATCNANTAYSDARFLAFSDSAIYMLGNFDHCLTIGDTNYYNADGHFRVMITKLNKDFGIQYIPPDSQDYVITESIIYPIPARNEIFISLRDSNAVINNMSISNSIGQLYSAYPMKINVNTMKIDIADLHPGFYILTLVYAERKTSYTFIKQ